MASVHSKNLNIFNAEQFLESVSEAANTRIYFTFGKSTAWSNESAPQQANSSVTSFNEVWYNMIGAKLLTGNDIRHVIPRYNWTANTSYAAYHHCTCSLQLFNGIQFYVVTSDWNVYKCLANANNSVSTVMPTSLTTNGLINTADGYVWKYMYTISPAEQLKFTTDDYIPVKVLSADDNTLQWDVQSNAVDGAVDIIKVTDVGSNYTSNDTITITVYGDGTGANASAIVNTTTNTIQSIYMDNPGRGYTYGWIKIEDSLGGTGANGELIISPPGGHGKDALRELGGSYLIINPRLQGTESDILNVSNEYRQLALVKEPYLYGTTTVASNTVVSQLTTVTVSGSSLDYIEDETVYQGVDISEYTFKGTVVEWDSANSYLKLSNVEGTPTSDVVIGLTSGAVRFVSSVTNPTFEPFSGRLLYIDNVEAIQRDTDQTEDFKIILSF